MSEQPTSLPFDVIAQIAPVARAVAAANKAPGKSDIPHYFHLEIRVPGDGRVAQVDGDDPYNSFYFGWDPDQEDKR